MSTRLPLLIIGAGPYGLAMAAYAKHKKIDHLIIGKLMDFWKANMPNGMYLRSGCDWHYDPANQDTIERYLETKGLKPSQVEPLERDFYLSYVDWFIKQKDIKVLSAWVEQLNYIDNATPFYEALLHDGKKLTATNVVLALGFRYFKNIPEMNSCLFPLDRFMHTCDLVDFADLKGKRVLIIGGRQSAFEWAALLHEQGVKTINLSYRHATPAFKPADWSWVNPIVDGMVDDPGWFRRLTAEEQALVNRRLWAEGRLKLEPWLASRVSKAGINLFPHSQVTTCRELPNGELQVRLDGSTFVVDQIIFATGYKVDVEQIPFLTKGNILASLEVRNGFPALDEHFQSNLPGLFFTSMCATQDFGPFFAFTSGIRTSAKLIGSGLRFP
jgi:cation diffusion facilitator CzcD-associated flavoprotein CzcO